MEDKYMRAVKRLIDFLLVEEEKHCFDYEQLAGFVKEEIERSEPLLPGVRYKNTEKNRARLPKSINGYTRYVTICVDGQGMLCAVYDSGIKKWFNTILDFAEDKPSWFALIPDGEVQDE
jgi:hypothetical protein